MEVEFAPVDSSYIKSLVQEGFYIDENEVVQDAVRRMREADMLMRGSERRAKLIENIRERALEKAKNDAEGNNTV